MSQSYSEEGLEYWDDHKNECVKRKHSIDLGIAVRAFDDEHPWMQKYPYLNSDGSFEEQYRTTGIMDGRFITVVSKTDEEDLDKIITAWDSSNAEIQAYFKNCELSSIGRRNKNKQRLRHSCD